MERDLGKAGPEPMEQEPEQAEAPDSGGAASSGNDQEEKMHEEETAAKTTKRPAEDTEPEAKRPRVGAEPESAIEKDLDMDEELNKLKMQDWNVMNMMRDYDFRRARDQQRFMRDLGEQQPDAVIGGASRSTSSVVMNFMIKAYKKQAKGEKFFVHLQDRAGISGAMRITQQIQELGPVTVRSVTGRRRQLRLITNSMEIERCIDKEGHCEKVSSVGDIINDGMKEEKALKTYGLRRLMTVDSNMKVEEVHNDGDHEDMDVKTQEAWDDVSGAALDPKEVRRARLKEIQYIKDKKVWRIIPLTGSPTTRGGRS